MHLAVWYATSWGRGRRVSPDTRQDWKVGGGATNAPLEKHPARGRALERGFSWTRQTWQTRARARAGEEKGEKQQTRWPSPRFAPIYNGAVHCTAVEGLGNKLIERRPQDRDPCCCSRQEKTVWPRGTSRQDGTDTAPGDVHQCQQAHDQSWWVRAWSRWYCAAYCNRPVHLALHHVVGLCFGLHSGRRSASSCPAR